MSESAVTVETLPVEILLLITSFLEPRDFISFCSASRIIHSNHDIHFSARYWRGQVNSTFRVPNRPVIENDGKRWMRLFKRMRTQTKVFTWGNNDGGCLGGETQVRGRFSTPGRHAPRAAMIMIPEPSKAAWPIETKFGRNIGIVADFQCGGWSSTALNSQGSLFTMGVMDGELRDEIPSPVPHRLAYPPGYASPEERHDSYTAIKQFSSGRTHILGLSDSGRIWTWDDTNRPALHVKFIDIDIAEGDEPTSEHRVGTVKSVVAGWNRSTAHIKGTGIVFWTPSKNSEIQGQSDQSQADGMLVLESSIVPDTNFERQLHRKSDNEKDERIQEIGEVVKHIALESYIVFVTDLGKAYACPIPSPREPRQLFIFPLVYSEKKYQGKSPLGEDDFIVDVQGAYKTFALLKRNGEVLLGADTNLHNRRAVFEGVSLDPAPLRRIPALQHTGVISLAFGDWHFHALHANGRITSYGMEQMRCGSLGLGGNGTEIVRGLRNGGQSHKLLPRCYGSGRVVCFEQEKRLWLDHLRLGCKDPEEANERVLLCTQNNSVREEVSEWFDQRLRGWDEDAKALAAANGEPVDDDEDDDGLLPYFGLSIAAAGWHSGAIVLVNEALAQKTRERMFQRPPAVENPAPKEPQEAESLSGVKSIGRWFLGFPNESQSKNGKRKPIWVEEAFPRLQLSNGDVLPGTIPITPWRDGPPDLREEEFVHL